MKLRARTLRPQFFASEQVTNCSMAARVLFQGLWCLADREGRLEDRPAQIKLLIFPVDKVNVESLLKELATERLVVRYETEGQRCIWLPKFKSNQPIHPHEAQSDLPECNDICNYVSPNSSTIPDVITSHDMSRQEMTPNGNSRDRDISKSEDEERLTPEKLIEGWNTIVAPAGLPKVVELTPKRKQLALARIKEHPTQDYWEQTFSNISTSRLLRGMADKGRGHDNWRASFDWVIGNPENPVKVYEGNYA